MAHQTITMSPALAKTILNASPRQARQVNPSHVADLAHRMQHPHPEDQYPWPVAIDRNGHLADGRHVLLAVIVAETDVLVNLTDGDEPNPFTDFDAPLRLPDDIAAAVDEITRAHDFDNGDAPHNAELLHFARSAELLARYLTSP